MAAVMLYGIIGFYFLDKRHFHIDFNIFQSFRYTLQNFFLIGSSDLVPYDAFARDFIYLIKISGFASISFLVYSLVRPYVFKITPTEDEKSRAKSLTQQFGKSALDFFKTYSDKFIYAPSEINAYISYRVNRNFAVVLENPVAENSEEMKNVLSLSANIVMKTALEKFITGCQKRVLSSIPNYLRRAFSLDRKV
jgi:phosphatidylglycerol lysyltransferase